jgi:uncharacterized protein YcbX
MNPQEGNRREVVVWKDTVSALDLGYKVSAWFEPILGEKVHLVFMDEACERPVAAQYGKPGDQVSFADGLPLLLTTQQSLKHLEEISGLDLGMARFRPNVVVPGEEPFSENHWRQVRIGDIVFDVTHPCVRCEVTKVDQRTGEKRQDQEPLASLKRILGKGSKVVFGINLIPRDRGVLRVGDRFEVLS